MGFYCRIPIEGTFGEIIWASLTMSEAFQGFGIYNLDGRHRLSLPRGLETYVNWFKPLETQDCLAMPGTRGMVLFPPAALEEHRELMARLDGGDPRPEHLGSALFALARAGTVTWAVTLGADRRFLLPLGARDLGIVPSAANASVALVAFRGAIEVWHPSELREAIQESASRWAELKARGLSGIHDG